MPESDLRTGGREWARSPAGGWHSRALVGADVRRQRTWQIHWFQRTFRLRRDGLAGMDAGVNRQGVSKADHGRHRPGIA